MMSVSDRKTGGSRVVKSGPSVGDHVKIVQGLHAYKKGSITQIDGDQIDVMLNSGEEVKVNIIDVDIDLDPSIMFAERANDPITW